MKVLRVDQRSMTSSQGDSSSSTSVVAATVESTESGAEIGITSLKNLDARPTMLSCYAAKFSAYLRI